VFVRHLKSAARAAAAFAVALAGIAPVQPASAQGLFEALFGGFDRAVRRELSPRVSAYSDPHGYDQRRERGYDQRRERRASSDRGGPSSGYCVRTCDGRHFPVRSSGGMSAAEQCKSFCPAAKTKVFSGSKIDHSVASDGTRYADLDNAFLYRERQVDNCTCNGKDAFGLAPISAETDPTLKPGDIVATNDGLVTFSGNRKSNSAEFTPIEQSGGSSEWRRRLMSIKVAPARERTEATAAVPPAEDKNAERTDRRRAQR
jgi:hypothetical protein